jgi:ribosomal protein S20
MKRISRILLISVSCLFCAFNSFSADDVGSGTASLENAIKQIRQNIKRMKRNNGKFKGKTRKKIQKLKAELAILEAQNPQDNTHVVTSLLRQAAEHQSYQHETERRFYALTREISALWQLLGGPPQQQGGPGGGQLQNPLGPPQQQGRPGGGLSRIR